MITYYLQVDADTKKVYSLFRWVDDNGLFTDWFNRKSGQWEDHPGLLAATGIGGDEDFVMVDEKRALEMLEAWGEDPGVLSEGGPGSGWFAPPRGTHSSQGGPAHAPGQQRLPGFPDVPTPGKRRVPGDVSPFEGAVTNGDITQHGGVLEGGITRPTEVEFDDRYPAIFKEHHGDRDAYHDGYSEVAAYELSLLLGPEEVVNEAVFGEYDGDHGTFHQWIYGTPGMDASSDAVRTVMEGDSDAYTRMEQIMALDFIVKNRDRHEGNWIVGDDGKIWAIDHGHADWTVWESGSPVIGTSLAWEGIWHNPRIDVPGVTMKTKYDSLGYGHNTLTFKFRESTLERWRQLTIEDFEATLDPVLNRATDRGTYTRVNIYDSWSNFQQLLDYGEITNVRPGP